MIALLSALLGFVSSATPELLKLFRDGKDRTHEIALLTLQMQQERERQMHMASESAAERSLRLQAIGLETQRAEESLLNSRLKEQLTGIHWVDALAGSVRPVLTYGFFLLYVVVKAAQFHLLLSPVLPWQQGLNLAQALVALWTEEDVAIFSAIMAFWFGSRIMRRTRG
jgi:hypothetical protein